MQDKDKDKDNTNKDPSRPISFPFAEPVRRPQKISEAQKRRIKLIESNITRTIEEMGQLHDMKMHVQLMKDEIKKEMFQENLMIRQMEEWYKHLMKKAAYEAKSSKRPAGSGRENTSPCPRLEIEGPPAKIMKEEPSTSTATATGFGDSKNETSFPWMKKEGQTTQVMAEVIDEGYPGTGMKVEKVEPMDI